MSDWNKTGAVAGKRGPRAMGWIGISFAALFATVCPLSSGAESFFAAPETAGSVQVKLHPTENVAAGAAAPVTFGVPFARGSVATSELSRVRVLDAAGDELAAHVEALALWRHVSDPDTDEASVRVARVQLEHTFNASYPDYENVTVEWGGSARARHLAPFTSRSGWHPVTNGTFTAADQVWEPDVYAVLPPQHLCTGALKPTRMLPLDSGVAAGREDPFAMDAVEHWPGYAEQDHALHNNFYTVINEDDPRVTAANECPYKTQWEPWLYDRAATMFVLYMRGGRFKALREAVRAAVYYGRQLGPDPSISRPDRLYAYNECLAYLYWLTGDSDALALVTAAADLHEASGPPVRWSPTLGFWTERHAALRLLANVVAYEVTGVSTYRNKASTHAADLIWHQNGADGALPADRVDGGLYHYGRQHGEGVADSLVASSWMTALLCDAMLRYYAVSEDAAVAGFLRRLGTFEAAACKTDSAHQYDTYGRPLTYPDYMMTWDGTSDPLDGRQPSMVEHALDVSATLAWAAFFARQTGAPDNAFRSLAQSLYLTYDIGVNYWIRPYGPTYGAPAFRVSPWRKWGWEHRVSGSLGWLMSALSSYPEGTLLRVS